MDPPVKKRGRPKKEDQPRRGRPKAAIKQLLAKKSETVVADDKKVDDKDSDQEHSGEIKTRSSAVKDSASHKLRPPKPPPYTNKEKWNRLNSGQKLYSMKQYNLSLIRRGLPVDKTIPGSFNFTSSKRHFVSGTIPYGSVKKQKNSDSNSAKNSQPNTVKKLKTSDSSRSKNEIKPGASEKPLRKKKLDPAKKDESSDSSDSDTEESDTEKEMPNLDLYTTEEDSQSSVKTEGPIGLNNKKLGMKKEMKSSRLNSAKGVVRPKNIPILVKYRERSRKVTKPNESPTTSKETDSVRHDSKVSIVQKKVTEKQNLTSSKTCLKRKRGVNFDDATKGDQSSNSSDSETVESCTEKEMPDLDLCTTEGKHKVSGKEVKTQSLSSTKIDKIGIKNEMKPSGLSSDKVLGTIKEIPILNLSAVENKHSESAKKTDVKIRSSVYTFTTKCDRMRRSKGILLTKKPINVISPNKMSTITMKNQERNRKVTNKPFPSLADAPVLKKVDTVGHDSSVILIQKKVPETQNFTNISNCLEPTHGTNVVASAASSKKMPTITVKYRERNRKVTKSDGSPSVLKEADIAGPDSKVILMQKKVSEKQSLASYNSLETKHVANSVETVPLKETSVAEIECKEQKIDKPNKKKFLEVPNNKEKAAKVIVIPKQSERRSSSLPRTSSVHGNNSEGTAGVKKISAVEKQSIPKKNPPGRSSRLSIRVKSIDSSSLETNSDGSPTPLSVIKQILEDQSPRMVNPNVSPSEVSVVKIPVKISRLGRGQKLTNPTVPKKLDNPENTSVAIKKKPKKEESENQTLLKETSCLNSEECKSTCVPEKHDDQENTPVVIKKKTKKEESESQTLLKQTSCLNSEENKSTCEPEKLDSQENTPNVIKEVPKKKEPENQSLPKNMAYLFSEKSKSTYAPEKLHNQQNIANVIEEGPKKEESENQTFHKSVACLISEDSKSTCAPEKLDSKENTTIEIKKKPKKEELKSETLLKTTACLISEDSNSTCAPEKFDSKENITTVIKKRLKKKKSEIQAFLKSTACLISEDSKSTCAPDKLDSEENTTIEIKKRPKKEESESQTLLKSVSCLISEDSKSTCAPDKLDSEENTTIEIKKRPKKEESESQTLLKSVSCLISEESKSTCAPGKFDSEENTTIVIKERPKKEESESQTLLKSVSCLISEDSKSTSAPQKLGSEKSTKIVIKKRPKKEESESEILLKSTTCLISEDSKSTCAPEKPDSLESTTVIIKEGPKKKESENQNLLKNLSCLNSEDRKSTRAPEKPDSLKSTTVIIKEGPKKKESENQNLLKNLSCLNSEDSKSTRAPEKLASQESTTIVIEEGPKKEASESQTLLKNLSCLNSEDRKSTPAPEIPANQESTTMVIKEGAKKEASESQTLLKNLPCLNSEDSKPTPEKLDSQEITTIVIKEGPKKEESKSEILLKNLSCLNTEDSKSTCAPEKLNNRENTTIVIKDGPNRKEELESETVLKSMAFLKSEDNKSICAPEKLNNQENTAVVIKEGPKKNEESESQTLLKSMASINSEDSKSTCAPEKLESQENSTILIKEGPKKEESDSQTLLRNLSCLNSEDSKSICDVVKTDPTSDVLEENEVEGIGSAEVTNLDVDDLYSKIDLASDILEPIEKLAEKITNSEETNLDVLKTDFTPSILEPVTEEIPSVEQARLDNVVVNSGEISNAELCKEKDEKEEVTTQLNNTETDKSKVVAVANELETAETRESSVAANDLESKESRIERISDLEVVDSNQTDTTETEELDTQVEEMPQKLGSLIETVNMDVGENTKVKMQSFEEAVPRFPEINYKSFQAQKDSNLDSSLHHTRMYNHLPECVVVLHRLTEEDLYKSYPSESEDNYDFSYDDKQNIDESWETYEGINSSKRRDSSYRTARRVPKPRASAFELYIQQRESYMNRRNRAYHSENSLDMSQDESRTFSDGAKPKKKLKRGRRYERDFEWRPDECKGIVSSNRKLRRHTRVIESDSSSSDDDFMDDDDDYIYNFYGYDEETTSNTVPSDNASSTAATNSELEKQSNENYSTTHQNSSQTSELKSTSQNIDPSSIDLVSDIIKQMDDQNRKNMLKTSHTFQHSNKNQSDPSKTERKRLKRPRMPSRQETDPNKVVASILKEIVTKVSSKFKKSPEKEKNKPMKVCKWCATPFQPNRSSDINCAICTDLGKGEVSKSLPTNKKTLNTLKIKCSKENKGKKTNSTMSRVLKNLSKNEKQRLIYSEKSDPKTSGKGYNHCKSFNTSKDTPCISGDANLSTSQNKTPNKFSLKDNKISTTLNQKNTKSDVIVNNKCDKTQIKPGVQMKPKIPSNVETHENKPSKNRDETTQNKSRVSLKKSKEGLFQMTFPDPDEELVFDDNLFQPLVSKSGTSFESANSHVTESPSQMMKQSESVKTKKYDTYLFPPVPTVIVSNYCSDTNNLNLSQTYFQNEITHQRAVKNSTSLSNPVKTNAVVNSNNTMTSISNTIAYQNSSISTNNITSNNSTSFKTSFNASNQVSLNSVSSLKPEASINNVTILPKTSVSINNISILPKTSVPAGSVTMLPTSVSLNNVTLSNLLSKTPIPSSISILPQTSISSNNVRILPKVSVPSGNLSILPIVTSVISLSDKNAAQTDMEGANLPSSFYSDNFVNSQCSEIKIDNVTSLKDDQSLLNSEPATPKAVNKRLPSDSDTEENSSVENESHNIAKRKKLDSERCSSDFSEPLDNTVVTNKPSTNEKDNARNLTDNNQPSDTSEKEKSTESNQEQKEQESSGSEETDKSTDDKEKTPHTESATQSAIDLLGAISILAVIDLEKNPQRGLDIRILAATSQLKTLMAQKKLTPQDNAVIASTQYDLKLLNIAKKYLRIYGTFGKVSEYLLRKANIATMIQIKKELHEEETNKNSCMFSQPTHLNNSSDMPRTAEMTANNNNQMQNFPATRSTIQPTPIEHLESQIAAMNNATINNSNLSQYGAFPAGGTIHHYPVEQMNALNHAVAAPAPITPRNDYLGNDSRETPSRGSGPRTPARPESAASQSEDTASLIQIKKEHYENTNLPSSQCAYAQNNAIPQISNQIPVMSNMPNLNMSQHSVQNTQIHLPVSNANQTYTNQTNYSVHTGGIAPNRTVAYNHQNYSDMYINVASKPQMQITPATTSAEMRQNQQMLLGQQMYIQNGSGLCSKQAVPSLNTNQYVIRPSYTTANTGGTIIVNNTQVGQNALLTNVTNQQFYATNPVSQLYYPPSGQMNCIPNSTIPTVITPDATAAQVQFCLDNYEHIQDFLKGYQNS